jgi:SP family sugar:H+ symporter-like MFS transporter
MTTASNWFWNFVLGFVTPYMVNSGPGDAGLGAIVFFIWAAFCILAVIFVWAFIYETKGLSLEQVDVLFQKCSSAPKSPAFRRTGQLETAGDLIREDAGKTGETKMVEK